MLTLILVIPIIGSIIILLQSHFIPSISLSLKNKGIIEASSSQNGLMKEIALTTSLITLFISLIL
jgi:hypothetical protein